MNSRSIITLLAIIIAIFVYYGESSFFTAKDRQMGEVQSKMHLFKDTGKGVLESAIISNDKNMLSAFVDKDFINKEGVLEGTDTSVPEESIPSEELIQKFPSIGRYLTENNIEYSGLRVPESVLAFSEEEVLDVIKNFFPQDNSSENSLSDTISEVSSDIVLPANPYEALDSSSSHAARDDVYDDEKKTDSLNQYLEANNSTLENIYETIDQNQGTLDPENPYHQLIINSEH